MKVPTSASVECFPMPPPCARSKSSAFAVGMLRDISHGNLRSAASMPDEIAVKGVDERSKDTADDVASPAPDTPTPKSPEVDKKDEAKKAAAKSGGRGLMACGTCLYTCLHTCLYTYVYACVHTYVYTTGGEGRESGVVKLRVWAMYVRALGPVVCSGVLVAVSLI